MTLCEDPAAITWGVAYEIAGDQQQQHETLSYLEWREKQYDIRYQAPLYSNGDPEASPPELSLDTGSHQVVVPNCLVYIAGPDLVRNSNYLGPAPLELIADQISKSVGPSGHNSEYLFELAGAMRSMGVHDEELFALEALVRERIGPGFA